MTREQAEKEIRDTFTEVWADGIIKALEQEPKTGHWITHHDSMTLLTGETATGGVVCFECGYKTHNKAHVLIGCPYKYCPNCGAKMAEGGNDGET